VHSEKLPVKVDGSQIEQVLINLATNARDAMVNGGCLTIETSLHAIDSEFITAYGYGALGRYACIAVSDTGSGMVEEMKQRIFEPFYTTKEVGKGTGLGLAIVYGIVKQHNGFINVYSESGHGTTFRVYLPIVETELNLAEKGLEQAVPQGGTETILIAEDDATVRKLMASVLTKFGYDVILAEDGQKAVDSFIEHRDNISLILMDMIMPNKNGREAYEEISHMCPRVKVLFSSGYTADFIENRGVSEKGIELILKPVQPMDLLRKIREMLDEG
jgi:polar amino acid transport system substrate-binding protein